MNDKNKFFDDQGSPHHPMNLSQQNTFCQKPLEFTLLWDKNYPLFKNDI